MAAPNGSVMKVFFTPVTELTDPADLATVNVDIVVYVRDSPNTPMPGLPIDMGTTSLSEVTDLIANDAADLYTLATTGSLP